MHFCSLTPGSDPIVTLTSTGEVKQTPTFISSSSPGTVFPSKMGPCARSQTKAQGRDVEIGQ